MALTSRQRSIHNKNNSKRASFSKGKRKASEGDIIVTSAPSDLRKIAYPGGAVALGLLLTARLAAAYWGQIADCDETYNYWEPLHYLVYGSGLQTWEYSPVYAIRSYASLWLFAIPAKLLSCFMEPVSVFYALRAILARQYTDFLKYAGVCLFTMLLPVVIIDSWHYGRLVIAPVNIVTYNILTDHGPDLYGVEPWTYYFVNGPLALYMCYRAAPRSIARADFCSPYWFDLLPLVLWLIVFMKMVYTFGYEILKVPFAGMKVHYLSYTMPLMVLFTLVAGVVGDDRTYLKPSRCHYLVDSDIGNPSTLEPPYYKDTSVWEIVSALPILNPEKSHKLFRGFYVPVFSERDNVFGRS
ncbi:Ferredoxin-fold anticodon-binding domain-containing protein 1 [Operophtera brumata]|uniref:Mannosyltransferase n=1 Tax=Operophtera brumata TaxID=104452 RepID=A0A0L7LNM4_OPEBR|nr:Ferredoxin-fold anticodon-binding domain-containing protein 1 [Operophtera brumata]